MTDRYITVKVGNRNVRKLRVEHIQFLMANEMAFWDRFRQKTLERFKKPPSSAWSCQEGGKLDIKEMND